MFYNIDYEEGFDCAPPDKREGLADCTRIPSQTSLNRLYLLCARLWRAAVHCASLGLGEALCPS